MKHTEHQQVMLEIGQTCCSHAISMAAACINIWETGKLNRTEVINIALRSLSKPTHALLFDAISLFMFR